MIKAGAQWADSAAGKTGLFPGRTVPEPWIMGAFKRLRRFGGTNCHRPAGRYGANFIIFRFVKTLI